MSDRKRKPCASERPLPESTPNAGTEIRDAAGRVIGHTAGVRPDTRAGRTYGDAPHSDAKRSFGL